VIKFSNSIAEAPELVDVIIVVPVIAVPVIVVAIVVTITVTTTIAVQWALAGKLTASLSPARILRHQDNGRDGMHPGFLG
jgi:hypothetical protein